MKITPPNPGLQSLNTATVREKWNLREIDLPLIRLPVTAGHVATSCLGAA
ncbi:MAG: hypothetical protein HYY78_09890 [Betaproteobacteria bacterium]|nr:hypothetical protein [Betaproteobacteria bacterium]